MRKTTLYSRVGPVSEHLDELSNVVFAADSPPQTDRRILESLPWRRASDYWGLYLSVDSSFITCVFTRDYVRRYGIRQESHRTKERTYG